MWRPRIDYTPTHRADWGLSPDLGLISKNGVFAGLTEEIKQTPKRFTHETWAGSHFYFNLAASDGAKADPTPET
jgi:hypothetical protein